jgi:uncharacterized membrane protein
MVQREISGISTKITRNAEILILVGIFILSSTLMLYQLDQKSPFVDESYTIALAQQTPEYIINWGMYVDIHPPMQHLPLHYFQELAGDSGVQTSRLMYVIFGLLSIICFYPMIRYLLDRNVALLSTFLICISPFLIMYSRMARYYSLVLFLSIIAFYLFFRILSQKSRSKKLDYLLLIIFLSVLLYTYIPGVAVVITQMCYLGYIEWKNKSTEQLFDIQSIIVKWKYLVVAWIATGLLFLPLAMVMYFAHPGPLVASLAVINGTIQFPLRFLLPFYVYAIGATMYPWTWYGILGLLIFFGLFIYALYHFFKEKEFGLLLLFIVPLFVTNCILQALNTSFIDLPHRAIFTLPFFIAIIGYAISRIKINYLKISVIIVIILISGISISNYYGDREFIDSMYIVPAKEIVADLQANLTPSDVVITQASTSVGYYWTHSNNYSSAIPIYTIIYDTPAIFEKINATNSSRYILLIENTDTHKDNFEKEWSLITEELVTRGYSQEAQVNYVPTDPTYKKFKEFVLRRPTFGYRLEEKVFSKT